MLVRRANIVPSIFFGHILAAKTRTGIMLIYIMIYNTIESVRANNLSGIPYF
jgi:hypothetical protein